MYADVDRDGDFFLQNKNLANIPGGWWELETQGCSQCKGEAEHCNVITHIVAVVITLQCHHLQHGLVIASLCYLLSSHLLKFHLPTLHLSMQVFSCINIALFCHQNQGHHQHDNNNQTWECGWRSHSWKSSTTPAHPPNTWRPGWQNPSHLSRTWDPSQVQCWACLCRAPMPRKAWGKMHLL